MPQILLDIRTSRSVNWKTATILYDNIFGLIIFSHEFMHTGAVLPNYNFFAFCQFSDRDTISRVATALSVESSEPAMTVSLLKMNSSTDVYERRENIKKSLLSFPTRQVGMYVFFFVVAWNEPEIAQYLIAFPLA